MSDISSGGALRETGGPRQKKGVSVHVTLFNAEHPAGRALVCAAAVVDYSELQRLLHGLTVLTIIYPSPVAGFVPLPADVFQTVVAALTAAVVAEVRAKHSLASESHHATSELSQGPDNDRRDLRA